MAKLATGRRLGPVLGNVIALPSREGLAEVSLFGPKIHVCHHKDVQVHGCVRPGTWVGVCPSPKPNGFGQPPPAVPEPGCGVGAGAAEEDPGLRRCGGEEDGHCDRKQLEKHRPNKGHKCTDVPIYI